ncbi:uncharacterized protein FIBRA_03027 [Fibroporia radiculosa]|uniref:Major facilitator superfamily (MFS) profile domain-containing protein n=1 Tax=Fibroporia radiculosa TaxID=599839 RepID=J4H264_9APHY|nr:uncharacterized protein FIBRA_03027 [Fibroporia radiculosa]CCM00979.1 predicted protein [Fibroporia radiculosa]
MHTAYDEDATAIPDGAGERTLIADCQTLAQDTGPVVTALPPEPGVHAGSRRPLATLAGGRTHTLGQHVESSASALPFPLFLFRVSGRMDVLKGKPSLPFEPYPRPARVSRRRWGCFQTHIDVLVGFSFIHTVSAYCTYAHVILSRLLRLSFVVRFVTVYRSISVVTFLLSPFYQSLPGTHLKHIATGNDVETSNQLPTQILGDSNVEHRMYKRRWIGVVAIFILNIVSGLTLVWFGPIANSVVDEFGFTLNQVNWLGNCVNIAYLPLSVIVPWVYARLGVRRTCYIGGALLVASSWVRYAGTAPSVSLNGAYALLLIGQILGGITQPIFQVLIPGYSEKWFDLKSRTTATMLMSIANPIGNGLGQLISPMVGSPSHSILILGIIHTAAMPFVFFITDSPPTPPTHAASQKNPPFLSLIRAMAGREPAERQTYMTRRQRFDFAIFILAFGVLVGVINAFSILSAQIMTPYGYSDTISGLMGAALLLVGIIAALVTAPLFDRVFTHHLALTCKVLSPVLGATWLSMIWAVCPDNTGALFALMAIIGATSLILLPVVVELAVELTRNADGSSALLWASSNLFGIILVSAEGALRDGADSSPPYGMHRALIFQGVLVCCAVGLVLFVEGKQTRRALDEQVQHEGEAPQTPPRGRTSLIADWEHGRPRSSSRTLGGCNRSGSIKAISTNTVNDSEVTLIMDVGMSESSS